MAEVLIVSCSVQYARAIGATAIGLDILTDLLSKGSFFFNSRKVI